MSIGRGVLFAILVVAGAAGLIFAWLVWPVPSPTFPWRTLADSSQEAGDCYTQTVVLIVAASMDFEATEEYLDAAPLAERCAPFATDDDRNTAIESDELLRESIQEWRNFSENATLSQSYFPYANWDWSIHQTMRRNANLGWFGWDDLVIAYRCEFVLEWSTGASLFIGPRPSSVLEENLQVPEAWLRRGDWCAARARTAAERITSRLEQGGLPKDSNFRDARDLEQGYADRAVRWGELRRHIPDRLAEQPAP